MSRARAYDVTECGYPWTTAGKNRHRRRRSDETRWTLNEELTMFVPITRQTAKTQHQQNIDMLIPVTKTKLFKLQNRYILCSV